MQTHYETIFIVNPDVGEQAIKDVVTKASSTLDKYEGKDVAIDEWGRKKLSYPIAKKNEGHYVVFTYTSEPLANKELELMLKYNEDVIRFQSVRLKERAKKAEKKAEGGSNE
ncbi:MAG: 30S ribosomal protein S6 [Deltaproteobacteria bacterium]|nr:30S ribosomal protein S6 [Deltaproteobacteria bacterium]